MGRSKLDRLAGTFAPPSGGTPSFERIALLIGNQGYDPAVGILRNPHKDIALVGEARNNASRCCLRSRTRDGPES
jgi:hypothetical protein